MKPMIKKGLVASGLAAVAVSFYLYLMPSLGTVSTDNAYVEGEISNISAEVSGNIIRVHVTDNQAVEAGQLLAEIDDSDYRARYDQAESVLAMTQAAIVNNQERIKLQTLLIEEARTHIRSVEADAVFQKEEWHRLGSLRKRELLSQSSYEAQQTRMHQADAALAAARIQLAAAEQQMKTLEAEQAQLVAQRSQAEAGLRLAGIDLENTKIRAPIAGIVGNREIRTGRFVNKGQPLLAIVPIQQIWVTANYKETQITDIQPGQSVHITLDSFPGYELTGQVLSFAPATGAQFSLLPPDNATGNFVKIVQRVPVKIAIDVPSELAGRVVPGLSAEVAIDTHSEASA